MPAPSQSAESIERLHALAGIASGVGAAAVAADATALAERVARGQLFVACLGQFKRGKSTLLNALLGEPVLPTGVIPVTSAVTIVRDGASPRARIHYRNGTFEDISPSQLAQYVTEGGNPDNTKGVAAVEVFHPSPVLRAGLCLVDTPGIGSSSPLASDVTRGFVPHVDAALVVLGADPPISGEELRLLEHVSAETGQFIFAINKADKLEDAELIEVMLYTRRLLASRLGVVPDAVFVVSATERLEGGAPTRDWARLEHTLTSLALDAKAALLQQRAHSTIQRLGRQLEHAIDTLRDTLQAPLAHTDARLAALRAWHDQAERAVADFGLLLAAEQQTVARSVREETGALMSTARSAAARELDKALDTSEKSPLSWRAVYKSAQDVARRAVQRELTALEHRASRAYQDAADRFVRLANDLLDRLSAAESSLAQLPPIGRHAELGGKRRFHFTEMMPLTARNPWELFVERVGPRAYRHSKIAARAQAYLFRLLDTNMSRVANDLEERLLDSRRELESEIRARVTELVASAERAAIRAREVRASGESAVRPELERLDALRQRVDDLVAVGAHERRPAQPPGSRAG